MVSRRFLVFIVLFAAVVRCDNYGSVLRAIDAMIAREEQREHMIAHVKGVPHSEMLGSLPHDYAYSDDYSVKDLTDGIAYVEALSGKGKPTLPVFTDQDKSDFTRVEVPAAPELTDQQKLHQQLTNQQALLDNQKKDQELKQKTLEELLKEEEKLKNPLNGVPTFTTDDEGNTTVVVSVCTPDMPNGIPCPGGRCQNGKCKPDQVCYEDCCDGAVAFGNGTPCKGGNCLDGRCRAFPVCVGECCTGANNDVAKANGTPCAQGHCFEGGCTSDVGCAAGVCCDVHKQRLFPKGFPCHVSACQEKSFCSGVSAFCPETEAKPDDSICPGGMCKSGLCAKTGVVSTNSTEKLCDNGVCCDAESGLFLAKGTACTNNPCMQGGACSGFSAECSSSPTAVHDGTPCPNGKCKAGECVAIAMCESGSECCVDGVLRPDYHVCNGGRCFQGKCVVDVPCFGECCKPHNGTGTIEAVANGSLCNNSTNICIGGKCVAKPLCVGECCEAVGVSADGKPCNKASGLCKGGMCVDEAAKCTNGTCCDETVGLMRPKGFPCGGSACSEDMVCTGTSVFCPVSPLNKKDGTPCPDNGKCYGGKCVLPPKHLPDCREGLCCDTTSLKFKPAGVSCSVDPCRETTYCTGSSSLCPVTLDIIPDGTVCKLTDKASTDWKCEDGICKEPIPTFTTANIDVDMTRNECHVNSPCCNTAINRVRPRGYVCSIAQTPCMQDVSCDGETPSCTPHVLEDGAACPGGSCVHGFCVKGLDPTDTEAVHEIHIHVVPKEHREPTPEEALRLQLLEDSEEDEEDSGSLEELMTIVTREVDGTVTERQMRMPLNALEKAQKKSLGLAGESGEKAAQKLAEKTEKIEKEARARIEALKAQAEDSSSSSEGSETILAVPDASAAATTTTATATPAAASSRPAREQKIMNDAIEEFTSLYPMPKTGIIDPLTGVTRLTDGKHGCGKGKCCDTSAGAYFTRGYQCDVPKNLCKVAACSGYSADCFEMNRPDGAVCPGGNCFDGTCIKTCVGECCDHHNLPRPNGVTCDTNAFCFEGVCVKNCTGECCNDFNFAKPNGATCTNGYCFDGSCQQTRDNMGEEAKLEATEAGYNPDDDDFFKAIPLYTHEPPRNMEEEWNKMNKKEAQRKEAEKIEEAKAAKRQEELSSSLSKGTNDLAEQAQLQAANAAKASKTMTYALIGGGGFVGILVVVAIIVAIVASKRKKEAKKDFDEYYDKF